jgi:histidinol dehydrogenase
MPSVTGAYNFKVAGVAWVTACTPPIRGETPAETVTAMRLTGADEILLLGSELAAAGRSSARKRLTTSIC